MNESVFIERLDTLLQERRQLRLLLAELIHRSVIGDITERDRLSAEIAQTVLKPLGLSARERPSPANITEAALTLSRTIGTFDNLIGPWYMSLVPSVRTDAWPVALKLRLSQLALASIDPVIAAFREAA